MKAWSIVRRLWRVCQVGWTWSLRRRRWERGQTSWSPHRDAWLTICTTHPRLSSVRSRSSSWTRLTGESQTSRATAHTSSVFGWLFTCVSLAQDVGRVLRGADEGDHQDVLLSETDHAVLSHHERGGDAADLQLYSVTRLNSTSVQSVYGCFMYPVLRNQIIVQVIRVKSDGWIHKNPSK